MRRNELTERISKNLAILSAHICQDGTVNLNSINVSVEPTYSGLLNRLMRWDLKDMNGEHINYPGIDLADPGRRIAVQITADRSGSKVKHTLEEFFTHGQEKDFDELIVMVTKDCVVTTKEFTVKINEDKKNNQPGQKITVKRDADNQPVRLKLWDVKYLMSRVTQEEDVERLQDISDYLDRELGYLIPAKKAYLLPGIPNPSESFVDGSRDRDVEALKGMLDQKKPVFICGVGGIGKTEVAIQLARKYAPDRGAFFLRYSGRKGGSLRETILRAEFTNYSFEGKDNDTRDKEYSARMQILRDDYRGSMLIIDHFDQPDKTLAQMKAEKTYRDLAAMDIQLVFTTRSQVPGGYDVRPLDERHLLDLMEANLENLGDNKPSKEELRSLLEAVNHHTLLAILIARSMNWSFGALKPAKILNAMKDSTISRDAPDYIPNEDSVDTPMGGLYDHMKALFDLSDMNEEEKTVLSLATLLPEDGMSAGLFRACLDAKIRNAMTTLVMRGWLANSSQNILTIHPVIREVCREELKPEKEHCTAFLDALYHHFSPDQEYDAAQFLQIARCFSRAAEMPDDTDREWSRRASKFWIRVGRHQTAVKYQQRVVEYRQSYLPPLHPDLAEAYEEMGGILCALGETQAARGYTEKALKIYKKVQPVPYEGLATANLSMGMVYDAFGNRKKALEYKLEAVKIRREHLADNQLGLAKVYSSLGSTYAQLKKYEMALQYQEEALRIRLDLLDETHPSVLDSMSLVATAHEKLGQADKAMELHQQVLQLRRQILPQDHPKLAISYSQIGIIHMKAENYADAYRYLRRAQQIQVKSLPANHKKRKDTTQNLKHVVDTLEKRGESIPADLDEQ